MTLTDEDRAAINAALGNLFPHHHTTPEAVAEACKILRDLYGLDWAAAMLSTLSRALADKDQRIAGYQGSRDHAINTLATALKVEPDKVRAVEYYARLASEALGRAEAEVARLRKILERYSEHDHGCGAGMEHHGRCSCGLDAAISMNTHKDNP